MEEMTIYYLLVILGILASSSSQVLLKKSADKQVKNILLSILNWRVIVAYLIFFASLSINIYAMKNGMNLKDMPILESLGYIFVPILSFKILKEKLTGQTIASIILIIVGIYIFYL